MEITATQLRGAYSPMEQTIFEALRRSDATSTELVSKVYRRPSEAPFNAQIVVNKAVITLQRKLEQNREPFRIKRQKLPGVRAIENRLIRNKMKLVK